MTVRRNKECAAHTLEETLGSRGNDVHTNAATTWMQATKCERGGGEKEVKHHDNTSPGEEGSVHVTRLLTRRRW